MAGQVLEVSRSGFYAWKKTRPSPRQQETQRLDQAIKALSKNKLIIPLIGHHAV